jgi:hypothetical protein
MDMIEMEGEEEDEDNLKTMDDLMEDAQIKNMLIEYVNSRIE